MREFERKQLLERVDREAATIGASIPDVVDLQGEAFELREFVFEVKRLDTVPADRREDVQEAKKLLRRERLQRRQRLEDADISREEGEGLVDAIVGIERALNALESLGTTSIEAEIEASERADKKRWFSFLQDALGHDDNEGIKR